MGVAQHSLDKIKSAPISKLIEGLGGKLKRVGREFVTQCIWHQDTNPSLTVNDDKGFCFCHVCREGGDAITYTRKRKGLEFFDAANLAGEILGIRVETDGVDPEEQRRRAEQRKRTLDSLKAEQQVYRNNLRDPRAGRIRGILQARGLTPEAAREFGIGYASDGYFGGRITIPIHNYKNELVGWTGRTTLTPEQDPAKYKNSADKPGIFEKKQLVFNEPRAKEEGRLAGSLIFVEGHLDVVSLWQHGVRNVVAMQGTGAPDPVALQRLSRSVRNFILCFDGDGGGKKAIEQFFTVAGPMASQGEISIRIAHIPNGQDPDEYIRENGTVSFLNLIHDSTPWLDWLIDDWAGGLDLSNGVYVTEVEKRLKALINGLKSNALRAHYINKAALALSRDDKEAAQLTKDWGNRPEEQHKKEWSPRSADQTKIVTSRRALRIYVHRPELRDQIKPMLDNIDHPPLAWLVQRLRELESVSAKDLTPHSIMAVVAVSEPHFLSQLRTIIQPKVIIDDSPGVIRHCSDILGTVTPVPNESDTDQPLT